jgi:hypothetical protein
VNALLLAAMLVADAEGAKVERLPAACVGRSLDLDRIVASGRCFVTDEPRPPPDAAAIGIELSPKKLKVRSGDTGRVTITLRNLTAAPLSLDVQDDCAYGFEPMLFAGNDTFRESPGVAGRSCNRILVRIRLAPRGVARIHVPVSATKTLYAEGEPIDAGAYKLVVNTPFFAPVPGSNDKETRQATGELTVVDR